VWLNSLGETQCVWDTAVTTREKKQKNKTFANGSLIFIVACAGLAGLSEAFCGRK